MQTLNWHTAWERQQDESAHFLSFPDRLDRTNSGPRIQNLDGLTAVCLPKSQSTPGGVVVVLMLLRVISSFKFTAAPLTRAAGRQMPFHVASTSRRRLRRTDKERRTVKHCRGLYCKRCPAHNVSFFCEVQVLLLRAPPPLDSRRDFYFLPTRTACQRNVCTFASFHWNKCACYVKFYI